MTSLLDPMESSQLKNWAAILGVVDTFETEDELRAECARVIRAANERGELEWKRLRARG